MIGGCEFALGIYVPENLCVNAHKAKTEIPSGFGREGTDVEGPPVPVRPAGRPLDLGKPSWRRHRTEAPPKLKTIRKRRV